MKCSGWTPITGCGNSTEMATVDITVGVVFVGRDSLVIAASKVEIVEIAAKGINGAVT